jgi:hypothetical protein
MPLPIEAPNAAPTSAQLREMNELFAEVGYCFDFNWAWDNYKCVVLEISRRKALLRHLEIGGGRDPLFLPEEAEAHGLSVKLNDISAQGLSLASHVAAIK